MQIPHIKDEEEPEEEEEEELGHAETYAEYMPMKCEYQCCQHMHFTERVLVVSGLLS